MIETTLCHLKELKNDRLWFSTNVRLVKLYMAAHDFQVSKAETHRYDQSINQSMHRCGTDPFLCLSVCYVCL